MPKETVRTMTFATINEVEADITNLVAAAQQARLGTSSAISMESPLSLFKNTQDLSIDKP